MADGGLPAATLANLTLEERIRIGAPLTPEDVADLISELDYVRRDAEGLQIELDNMTDAEGRLNALHEFISNYQREARDCIDRTLEHVKAGRADEAAKELALLRAALSNLD